MGSAAGKPTLDLTDTSIVLHVPADEEKLTRIAEHLTSHRKSISTVTAAGCALMHTQLGALLPLIFQCPRLVELDVSDNQLDSSRGWWPVCYALQSNTSLQRLLLGGERSGNRIGCTELAALLAAASPHPALAHLDFQWATTSINLEVVLALVALLRSNRTLHSIPIAKLLAACEPQHRRLVLDALCTNVGLRVECSAMLPLDVRILCRRVLRLDDAAPASVCTEPSGLVLDAQRLSRPSTWRLLAAREAGAAFEAVLDGECSVCVRVVTHIGGGECDIGFIRELELVHELGAKSDALAACVHAEHVLLPSDELSQELAAAHAGRTDMSTATNTMWLVSRFVPDVALAAACRSDALDEQARVRILHDVSSCVARMHACGLLHRNLATYNVMLDTEKRAHVCLSECACRVARAWCVSRVPAHFAPPEFVATGGDAMHTRASDVWAFGMLAIEVMCGANPLATLAPDELVDSYSAWAYNREQPYDVVDTATPPVLSTSTSGYFDTHHVQHPRPEATASVYLSIDALQAVCDVSHADSDAAGEWWQANGRLPSGTLCMRAVSAIAHACCRFQASQRPSAALVARALECVAVPAAEWKLDPESEICIESVADLIVVAQVHSLGFEVARWWWRGKNVALVGDVQQRVALERALEWHRAALLELEESSSSDEHLDTGAACARLAMLFAALGESDEALIMQERAISIRKAVLGSSKPMQVASGLSQAASTLAAPRNVASRLLYARAASVREAVVGSRHPDFATSLCDQADALTAQGDFASALKLYERARAIYEETLGDTNPCIGTCLCSMAQCIEQCGDFSGARPLHERALAIFEAALGQQHSHVATVLNNLAISFQHDGDFAAARSLFERSLSIRLAVLGAQHASVATSYSNLAALSSQQHEYAEARTLYQRALAVNQVACGADSIEVATNLTGLCAVLKKQGDNASALSFCARALAIFEATLGSRHQKTITALSSLASLHKRCGDYTTARSLYERVFKAREETLVLPHADMIATIKTLANLHADAGAYSSAQSYFERALVMSEALYGALDAKVLACVDDVAGVLEDQDNVTSAIPFYMRALAICETTLGSHHVEVARRLCAVGDALPSADACPLYARALTIHERTGDKKAIARTLAAYADALFDKGDYTSARPLLERVLTLNIAVHGEQHATVADTRHALAAVLSALGSAQLHASATLIRRARIVKRRGNLGVAEELVERALEMRETTLAEAQCAAALFEQNKRDQLATASQLVARAQQTDNLSAALRMCKRALAIREAHLGPQHIDVGACLFEYAARLSTAGDYASARPLLERSLVIHEASLGADDVRLAPCLHILAGAAFALGDDAAARPLFERLLIAREATSADTVSACLYDLGAVCKRQGDVATALVHCERALKLDEAALGAQHPIVAAGLNTVALLLSECGEDEAAKQHLELSLLIFEAELHPDHAHIAATCNNLAALLCKRGELAAAQPLLQRALNAYEAALGPSHTVEVGVAAFNLAAVVYRQGEYASAAPLFERALSIAESAHGARHADAVDAASMLARALDKLGESDRAAQLRATYL